MALFVDLPPLARNQQNIEDYLYTGYARYLKKSSSCWKTCRNAKGRACTFADVAVVLDGPAPNCGSVAITTPYYTVFEEKIARQIGWLKRIEGVAGPCPTGDRGVGDSSLPGIGRDPQSRRSRSADRGCPFRRRGGDGYYAWCLRHHTTTDLSADEIHQIGLRELQRIHQQMYDRFGKLGYPESESISSLYARLAQEVGILAGERLPGPV